VLKYNNSRNKRLGLDAVQKTIVLSFPIKQLPKGVRLTQTIVALTSIVTILGMIAITVVSILVSNQSFRSTYSLDGLTSGQMTPDAVNPEAVPAMPSITLTSDKQVAAIGEKVSLSWSVSDNSARCSASDDWSGDKSVQGNETSTNLDKPKIYLFTLTCSTGRATSFAVVSIAVGDVVPVVNPEPQTPAPTQNTGSGNTATRPKVSLTITPNSIKVGSAATLSWSVTNSPTSCTAGGTGGWTGSKASSGSQSTGTLSSVGIFSYSLTCSNGAGSETATTNITVSANAPVVSPPVVSLSISPATILSGSAATLSWSVTNSPTSCTAGGTGGWTGSKASSGSQSTGSKTTGTYTYTLSCANSGGTGTKSVSLTVNPAPVYCAGKTPCYGKSDLAAHASVGNCWAWNNDWVINITSYSPVHKGGIMSGSSSTLENAGATCNHSINSILKGSASIPGYKDKRSNSTFSHKSDTINNTTSSALIGYRVGYYDASKP
jgi:hypothetical protein